MEEIVVQGIKFPYIENIDWEYAWFCQGDYELIMTAAQAFYSVLDTYKEQILTGVSGTGEEDFLAFKTIVHTLKSNAGTTGAVFLAKLARLLEKAAIAHDENEINVLIPVIAKEIDRLKVEMKVILPKEKRLAYDEQMVSSLLFMLKQAIENTQIATADYVIRELMKYEYDAKMQNEIEHLSQSVLEMKADEILESIERLLKR
ncbi:MAG: Hpt domain-containing protein [Lachnospiraceae bacterium]|nr:Hpt domain-containing protein [Lachnospiraceae bacterium]